MKKLAIVSAIAASLSSGAHAIFPIPQLVLSSIPLPTAICPGISPPFEIALPAGMVQMKGEICLEPNGAGNAPFIRLGFHTVTGTYFGAAGTLFDIGGSIQIDVQTTSSFVPYATIAVSPTNPIDCTTATGITGLQVIGSTIPRPGHFPPANLAVCNLTLFGPAQLFIN